MAFQHISFGVWKYLQHFNNSKWLILILRDKEGLSLQTFRQWFIVEIKARCNHRNRLKLERQIRNTKNILSLRLTCSFGDTLLNILCN